MAIVTITNQSWQHKFLAISMWTLEMPQSWRLLSTSMALWQWTLMPPTNHLPSMPMASIMNHNVVSVVTHTCARAHAEHIITLYLSQRRKWGDYKQSIFKMAEVSSAFLPYSCPLCPLRLFSLFTAELWYSFDCNLARKGGVPGCRGHGAADGVLCHMTERQKDNG